MVVKKVTAASLTIVLLTDLSGAEIWTEAAGGLCHRQMWHFWLVDHPEFSVKTTGNNNKHEPIFVKKTYRMWWNVIISSHEGARQSKLQRKWWPDGSNCGRIWKDLATRYNCCSWIFPGAFRCRGTSLQAWLSTEPHFMHDRHRPLLHFQITTFTCESKHSTARLTAKKVHIDMRWYLKKVDWRRRTWADMWDETRQAQCLEENSDLQLLKAFLRETLTH